MDMIEKRDLRSGNICLIPNDKSIFDEFASRVIAKPVHEIWRYGATFENGQFVEYEKIFPLDITPELLIQCGFETDQITYWYPYTVDGIGHSFVLGHFKYGFGWLRTELLQDAKLALPISYFHTLQNLFYFISGGQELTLKQY